MMKMRLARSSLLGAIIAIAALLYHPCKLYATEFSDVVSGVGRVEADSYTGSTPIVYILEERHNSITGQIQQAVMLLRLNKYYNVKSIALEGYVASKNNFLLERVRSIDVSNDGIMNSMYSSLYGGAISAAEFSAAALKMDIYAIEREDDYISLDGKTYQAISGLYQLVTTAHMKTLHPTREQMEQISSTSVAMEREIDKEKKVELAANIMKEMYRIDPWIKEHAPNLLGECRMLSLEDEINNVSALRSEAIKLGVKYPDVWNLGDWRHHVEQYISFIAARKRASDTMFSETIKVRETRKSPVAMIIGAAHTARVYTLLKEAGVRVVVLRSLSLSDCTKGNNVADYRALEEGRVVEQGALGKFLKSVFEHEKKPQPRIGLPVNQAKDQLYGGLYRLGAEVLRPWSGGRGGNGGGEPPRNGTSTPSPLPDPRKLLGGVAAKIGGAFISFDIDKARFGHDVRTGTPVLILPVTMKNPEHSDQSTMKWVRLEINIPSTTSSNGAMDFHDLIEKRLLRRIKESEEQSERGNEKTSDKDVLHIADDINARILSDKEEAMSGVLISG